MLEKHGLGKRVSEAEHPTALVRRWSSFIEVIREIKIRFCKIVALERRSKTVEILEGA